MLALFCSALGACAEEPEGYIRECGRAPWPTLGGGPDAAFRMCAPGPDDPDAEFELIAPMEDGWPIRGMSVGPDHKLYYVKLNEFTEVDLDTLERRTRRLDELLPEEHLWWLGDSDEPDPDSGEPDFSEPWAWNPPIWCEPGVIVLSAHFPATWTHMVVSDDLEPMWIDHEHLLYPPIGYRHPSVLSCGADETLYMPWFEGILKKYTVTGELLWADDAISSELPVLELDGTMYQVRWLDSEWSIPRDPAVIAADPSNGALLWTAALDHYWATALAAGSNDDIIVMTGASLSAFARRDGSLRWRLPHDNGGPEYARGKPAVRPDGSVMFSDGNRLKRAREGEVESQLLTGKGFGFDLLVDPLGHTFLLACGYGCDLMRFTAEAGKPLLADRRWPAPHPSWTSGDSMGLSAVSDGRGAIIVEHDSGIYRLSATASADTGVRQETP